MLLGFKRRFVPFVLDGTKHHTIRAKRKVAFKSGQICHCYTGLCQKGCELLGRWPCTRVQDIVIEIDFGPFKVPFAIRVWIDGEELTGSEVNMLCWTDGFRESGQDGAWLEFAKFWAWENRNTIRGNGTLLFEGHIIFWDHSRPVGVTA